MSSYEKLEVWQKAIDWSCKLIKNIEHLGSETERKHYRLLEQIESSSTSVALNIAEGNGRYSKKEFIRFLYISRGSLYETMTLLEIFKKLNWLNDDISLELKYEAEVIAKMLNALIASIRNQQPTTNN